LKTLTEKEAREANGMTHPAILPRAFQLDLHLPANHEIQDIVNDYGLQSFYMRETYCDKYSYALITKDFIEDLTGIIGGKTAIEVAAGPGWLSYWLRKRGARVILTTDNMSWHKNEERIFAPGITKGDAAETVLKTNTDFVILSWPYMDKMASKIWEAMAPGQKMVYIGEGEGGCCADDTFFSMVLASDEEGLNWEKRVKSLLQWQGLHDRCHVLEKK